jgi:putative protease
MPKKESKEEAKEEKLGEEVGKVTHYFTKIGVAVIELSGDLKEGDKIRIKGATSDFKQPVKSMQIEHEKIEEAKAGQSIGMKVKEHAREGDTVYKV